MTFDPKFDAGRPDIPHFALTFDDGPDRASLNRWLKTLEEGGARGTFFFTGEWLDRHPALARQIIKRGHELAHHSYHHRRMGEIPDRETFCEELKLAELAYQEATGLASPAFFRYPYLHYREDNQTWLSELAYVEAEGGDSGDWAGIEADEIASNVLPLLASGAVIVHHANDIAVRTPDALPVILEAARAKGLEPVLASELLRGLGRHPGYRAWSLHIDVPAGGPDLPESWVPIDTAAEARRLADESYGWLTAAAAVEAAGSKRAWRARFAQPLVSAASGLTEDRTLLAGRYFADKYWGYVRLALQGDTLHLLDFASREAQADTSVYMLRWLAQEALAHGCRRMTARRDMRRLEQMCRQLGWHTSWVLEKRETPEL